MFKRAERKQTKIKMAVTGPSGSGKTWGALEIASGLGQKIAVIDTECGSASLYSDKFEFDVLEINPPYNVEKYIRALDLAIEAKYDVVIIDSISHAWAGEGGLLSVKESLDARPKSNSFTNWGQITKMHEKFKAKLISAPIHIICTIRSKQGYVLTEKDGKQVPQKVGLDLIQREGIEYEFAIVFDIAMNHEVDISKDRTSLFANRFFKLNKAVGEEIKAWLESARPQDPPKKIINHAQKIIDEAAVAPPIVDEIPFPSPEDEPPQEIEEAPPVDIMSTKDNLSPQDKINAKFITIPQTKRLWVISKEAGYTYDHMKEIVTKGLNAQSTTEIPWQKYNQLIECIEMRMTVDQIIKTLKREK